MMPPILKCRARSLTPPGFFSILFLIALVETGRRLRGGETDAAI
jgi:hypothetical protein